MKGFISDIHSDDLWVRCCIIFGNSFSFTASSVVSTSTFEVAVIPLMIALPDANLLFAATIMFDPPSDEYYLRQNLRDIFNIDICSSCYEILVVIDVAPTNWACQWYVCRLKYRSLTETDPIELVNCALVQGSLHFQRTTLFVGLVYVEVVCLSFLGRCILGHRHSYSAATWALPTEPIKLRAVKPIEAPTSLVDLSNCMVNTASIECRSHSAFFPDHLVLLNIFVIHFWMLIFNFRLVVLFNLFFNDYCISSV